MRWKLLPTILAAFAIILFAFVAVAQQQPTNILVIMGDDIRLRLPVTSTQFMGTILTVAAEK
jgi:hypothetical protein